MGTSKIDSSTVFALFEELKQKIDELGKGGVLNGQVCPNPEEFTVLINDLHYLVNQKQFTPEQIKELQKNLAQVSAYSLSKANDNLTKVLNELKAIIIPISQRNGQLQTPQNYVIRREHVFTVDFRNSKAATTIIAMALFILISLGGNVWQIYRNTQLRDNDLKYRYIKMHGKASPQNLLRLETIFTYTRNRDSVTVIRNQVETYEQMVKEQAERIESERLEERKKNEVK